MKKHQGERGRVGRFAAGRLETVVLDLCDFGWGQLKSCVFAGGFFVVLVVSKYIPLGGLPRYDFLLAFCVAFQILLVVLKIETREEVLAICVFHVFGLVLELYKTSDLIGSWAYPEFCYAKIGTVPLYAGFMYAAVGSYIMRAWRLFALEFRPFPPLALAWTACALIYANFFTNHWIADLRWVLAALVALLYFRTRVYFTVRNRERRMPLLAAFVLIALFVWIAENMATYLGAWAYPNQRENWQPVSVAKLSSWSLLVIISFIVVANYKHKKNAPGRGAH